MIVKLQENFPNDIKKKTLKTWNFTESKLCLRLFGNNIKKVFRKDILENAMGYIFAKCLIQDV